MELGGRGYLLKNSAIQEVVVAVRAVHEGRMYVSSAMASHLIKKRAERMPELEPASSGSLTRNEQRILELIGKGKSSKEVAEILAIHYRTVENHRTNMCKKLGLEGTNALLRFALQKQE